MYVHFFQIAIEREREYGDFKYEIVFYNYYARLPIIRLALLLCAKSNFPFGTYYRQYYLLSCEKMIFVV